MHTTRTESSSVDPNPLGHASSAWPAARHEQLLAELAGAVAKADKDRVFVVAARIVAAGTSVVRHPTGPDDHLLPIEEVARRLDISVRTLDRRLADLRSDFPQPIRFGGPRGQRKWSPLQIDAYLAQRARVRT